MAISVIEQQAVQLAKPASQWEMMVHQARMVSQDIRELVLKTVDGVFLPPFVPGSHLVVHCQNGSKNSYSLTGPYRRPEYYSIAVRREESGKGGSRWLHEIPVGQQLTVSAPRTAFAPVLNARHHVLIAGGIGVTPILSHARAAVVNGASFEVWYVTGEENPAFREELTELSGGRIVSLQGRSELYRHLDDQLVRMPIGTHLYCCGPGGMIESVARAASASGWPQERVHSEAFSSGADDPGEPFEAVLASGKRIAVPSGVSLLEALEKERISVPNLCRQGVCGECRVSVLRGKPLHRDIFLTREEKQAGDCMMPCVSRSVDQEVELQL